MKCQLKNKWIIGLTGSILSGKSTALTYFKQAGAAVISCDEIVRELYTRPAVLQKIKAQLGSTDKAEIAALVFKNAAKRKQLEQILHPLILKAARSYMQVCSQPLVVWEVPLLFEAGWEKYTDLTIAVVAAPDTLPLRLKGRHLSKAEYQRRLQTQGDPLEKAARADMVFFHANKNQLKRSVQKFCEFFKVVNQGQ